MESEYKPVAWAFLDGVSTGGGNVAARVERPVNPGWWFAEDEVGCGGAAGFVVVCGDGAGGGDGD